MARPKKQGLDYFPHDTDAMNDEKLEIMQALYGNDGYAFYFKMLERVYRTEDLRLDISDAETRKVLAKKFFVDEERFEKMVYSSIKYGLFDEFAYESSGLITSHGILKRAETVLEKRKKMRQTYINQGVGVSEAETVQKSAETREETPQSKVKKSKEKKSINISNTRTFGEFVEISEDEYQSLLDKYGEPTATKCIQELDNYKGSTGKKYKSDYRAILSWVADRVSERDRKQQVLQYPVRQAVKTTEKPKMVMHTATAQVTDDAFDFEEAKRIAALLDGGV
jgi:hypothetical protein